MHSRKQLASRVSNDRVEPTIKIYMGIAIGQQDQNQDM